jgi:cytochrome c biogenesis protein CcdA/glutaredoxin
MKKKQLTLMFILMLTFTSGVIAQTQENESYNINNSVDLVIFYGQGCPHCSKLRLFLDEKIIQYPNLKIHEYEVYQNNSNRILFQDISKKFDTEMGGVPTVFIDEKVIIGFSNSIGKQIEDEIINCRDKYCGNPLEKEEGDDVVQIVGESSPSNDPSIGKKLTIPLVVSAAAVDAINPCAFAVLIILMTAALAITNKKKALIFGLAFTVSIYISYFLIGLGLFSALQATGMSHGFYIFVTILAFIVGLLNVKDYFWYGKGILMEIPLSWRPKLKKMLKSVTTPVGAFFIGFAVSLFELPCTGGPYIVILGLLAREVTKGTGILYLLLYNLVFVSPLIILSFVIYKGLSTTAKLESIRKEKLRLLHLIAGILMLGIAIAMIISLYLGMV